ncbi:MAG: NAD-dependent protein deacylase [Defluviitaleaceae bacterium]|nr:NAD-dependent protein deacylase [Defluviitaleaceae bacterium]
MVDELRKLVTESDNIVFFGGAGVSTESGIPDFRSRDGLYNQHYDYPPEVILSQSFFIDNPKEFYRFYKNKLINEQVKPNAAHVALSYLENTGKLKAVITQNIDGLHQMAGSVNVLELHGSIHRNSCMDCAKPYDMEIIKTAEIPYCGCGGLIKPDVVLFEEQLDNHVLTQAVKYISQADMLIIGGTSLSVYPAAGLVDYYTGNKLVMINNGATPYDGRVNLLIRDSIGKVMGYLSNPSSYTIPPI